MFRTDLAIDACEFAGIFSSMEASNLTDSSKISGVTHTHFKQNGYAVSRVQVETELAAKQLGKSIGQYVTIESVLLRNDEDDTIPQQFRSQVVTELMSFLERFQLKKDASVLVVGLGNRNVTPDSLGPAVIERLVVTRHFFEYMPQALKPGTRAVSVIAPGVLGTTGIETADVISGLVERIQPDLVIVIDALASASVSRLHAAIQITDSGIQPGSGVGNKRKAFSSAEFGRPVLAIGVPTVMYISSILKEMWQSEHLAFHQSMQKFQDKQQDLIVTPKNTDQFIENIAELLAEALNQALHESVRVS